MNVRYIQALFTFLARLYTRLCKLVVYSCLNEVCKQKRKRGVTIHHMGKMSSTIVPPMSQNSYSCLEAHTASQLPFLHAIAE